MSLRPFRRDLPMSSDLAASRLCRRPAPTVSLSIPHWSGPVQNNPKRKSRSARSSRGARARRRQWSVMLQLQWGQMLSRRRGVVGVGVGVRAARAAALAASDRTWRLHRGHSCRATAHRAAPQSLQSTGIAALPSSYSGTLRENSPPHSMHPKGISAVASGSAPAGPSPVNCHTTIAPAATMTAPTALTSSQGRPRPVRVRLNL